MSQLPQASLSQKEIQNMYAIIANKARHAAGLRKEEASANGSFDDGGARNMNNIIEAWQAGLAGNIPSTLKVYEQDAFNDTIRARDTAKNQYNEYVRLGNIIEPDKAFQTYEAWTAQQAAKANG